MQYLNQGLKAQVKLDLAALQQVIGRTLTATEADDFCQVQEFSYQQVFLFAGITHPNFIQTVRKLSSGGYAQIAAIAF
jgi:tetraacyldisaccharide-1-P 4'-kinase